MFTLEVADTHTVSQHRNSDWYGQWEQTHNPNHFVIRFGSMTITELCTDESECSLEYHKYDEYRIDCIDYS